MTIQRLSRRGRGRQGGQQRLTGLRADEIEEARIKEQIATAYPGESVSGPAMRFEDLSPLERHIVHFIALRGRIRRIPDLLPAFQASSGIALGEFAFRSHLTRLQDRGAVVRGHLGWAVAPEMLVAATELPAPVPAKAPKTGMGVVLAKSRSTPRASWSPQPANKEGWIPPALKELLERTPKDRAFRVGDLLSGTAPTSSLKKNVMRLVAVGLLVRLGQGVYARSGVEVGPAPLPQRLYTVLRSLPKQRAISLSEWAKAATGGDNEAVMDAMAARAAVLVRQGRVQEVSRGLYRRRKQGEGAVVEDAVPVAVHGVAPASPAANTAELSAELAAVLALVPPRSEITLDALEVAADGEPGLTLGKLSGHVYRLVQRGVLERTVARTYRRVQKEMPEEIGLLRHFEGGIVLRLAEVVVKEEKRVTASGLGRMKEALERLIAEERLERSGGGYRKVEERVRSRGVAAVPSGVRVHLKANVVVLAQEQAKALAELPAFEGVLPEAWPAGLDAVALKAAGLAEEKEGRWNRVFEVWLEGLDDWTGERALWLEMAACADDEAELARMMGGAAERAGAVWAVRVC